MKVYNRDKIEIQRTDNYICKHTQYTNNGNTLTTQIQHKKGKIVAM